MEEITIASNIASEGLDFSLFSLFFFPLFFLLQDKNFYEKNSQKFDEFMLKY